MKIEFIETLDNIENFFQITKDTTFKEFKNKYKMGLKLYLSKNFLQISNTLYGKSKQETQKICKKNCKNVLKMYKFLIKVIKWIKHKDKNFDGKFYVKTKNKKNNNDFMLEKMLQLKFEQPYFLRLSKSLSIACDYLSKENNLNNMCDFKNNICANYRNLNVNREVGCCSTKCKHCSKSVCNEKNISCKLFMCNYLVKKGFYFNPHTIPILRQNLSYFDRLATHAVLFRSTKQCFKFAWFARISTCLIFTCFLLYFVKFIIKLF